MRINSKCQARRNSCGAWLVIYSVIGLNEPRMYAPFPHLECVRRVVQLNHAAWKRVYSVWNRFPAYWREVNSLVLPLSLLLEIQAESRSWGVEFDVLSPSLCLCREAEQQLGRVHELKCLNWNLKATGVLSGACGLQDCVMTTAYHLVPSCGCQGLFSSDFQHPKWSSVEWSSWKLPVLVLFCIRFTKHQCGQLMALGKDWHD